MENNKTPNILCVVAIALISINLLIVLVACICEKLNININSVITNIVIFILVINHVAALITLGYSRIKYKWHTLSGVLFWVLISETILLIIALMVLMITIFIAISACVKGVNILSEAFMSCPG